MPCGCLVFPQKLEPVSPTSSTVRHTQLRNKPHKKYILGQFRAQKIIQTLERIMASSSPKIPRARSLAPYTQNSGLPIPFELREQILKYLLISTNDILELNRGRWPLYRCGSEYIQSTTGGAVSHINDLVLSRQFRTLTQVSRQMRADAIIVLFYRNKWHLTISLCRDEETWGSHQFVGWDSASMVRKLWGQEAILSMRYLKLTVENESKSAQKRILVYLQRLVKTLCLSRNLRRLEVEWLDHDSLIKNLVQDTRDRQRAKIQEVARRADGTRLSTKHFKGGVSRWEAGQMILKPLESLRGIPEAVVTGCVTDRWAEHLERDMKSGRPAPTKLGKKKTPKRNTKAASLVATLSP